MRVLGIDLAAEAKQTGGCAVDWLKGRATVVWAGVGLTDKDILERASEVDVVGIDSPFGWPTYFVEAICAHHAGRPWPVGLWEQTSRRKLRLRATDEFVHRVTGITPLSVSSDTIAIPATRWAGLLHRLGVADRSGDGRVFEVYPAATLRQWGFPYRGYKKREDPTGLTRLLEQVCIQASWLELPAEYKKLCGACDHVFDALVASLAARAAAKGLSMRPSAEESAVARVEGWIALPQPGTLGALA